MDDKRRKTKAATPVHCGTLVTALHHASVVLFDFYYERQRLVCYFMLISLVSDLPLVIQMQFKALRLLYNVI